MANLDLPPGRHDDRDDRPGLPGLATWRKVYWLVAGSFLLWVALLFALMKTFA